MATSVTVDAARIGADWTTTGLSGDKQALFLKIFGGEVLTAFDELCIMRGKHKEKNISSGKSAQFPVTWKLSSEYHTIGSKITGMDMPMSEKTIEVDGMLISHVFISNYEEAMSHFEARQEYTRQTGLALATAYDKNVFRTALLAANSAATILDADNADAAISEPGKQIDIGATATGALLAAGLYAAKQNLDEKDVIEQAFAIFRPAEYYALVAHTPNIDINWKGDGSYSKGKIGEVAGIEIYKSNNLPSTDESADATVLSKYRGDWDHTVGLVMTPSAVGTVKLLDLATESSYEVTYQGTFVVSKMAVGHGVLRPECAVELHTTVA